MKKAILYNKSKQIVEDAFRKKCPRCKGFGAVFQDHGDCDICKGRGECWVSESGWTLALWGRIGSEKLY